VSYHLSDTKINITRSQDERPNMPPVHAQSPDGRARCPHAKATLNFGTYRASEVTCPDCLQFLLDARRLCSPRPYDSSTKD
jgi:hypothetical protein